MHESALDKFEPECFFPTVKYIDQVNNRKIFHHHKFWLVRKPFPLHHTIQANVKLNMTWWWWSTQLRFWLTVIAPVFQQKQSVSLPIFVNDDTCLLKISQRHTPQTRECGTLSLNVPGTLFSSKGTNVSSLITRARIRRSGGISSYSWSVNELLQSYHF